MRENGQAEHCMAMYRAKCERRVPPVPVPKEVVESVFERFKKFMRRHPEIAVVAVVALVVALVAWLARNPWSPK